MANFLFLSTLSRLRLCKLDDAETELRRQANEDRNTTALIFFLKTQGKGRGYTERHEVTGADGAPQRVQVEYVNNPIETPEAAPGTRED